MQSTQLTLNTYRILKVKQHLYHSFSRYERRNFICVQNLKGTRSVSAYAHSEFIRRIVFTRDFFILCCITLQCNINFLLQLHSEILLNKDASWLTAFLNMYVIIKIWPSIKFEQIAMEAWADELQSVSVHPSLYHIYIWWFSVDIFCLYKDLI